ncbi:hypothetical protein RRG08_016493 [Elysia crispata]|uniref:Uncharacterized protein n=1 Tax=Elysia crispata TaxID=231223 RepID=A0AAE0Y8X5_9GAST|nr:hypothetical protein RRG08_016493 [Elysia crispata]
MYKEFVGVVVASIASDPKNHNHVQRGRIVANTVECESDTWEVSDYTLSDAKREVLSQDSSAFTNLLTHLIIVFTSQLF